ncbi:MAG: amidohydrolase family protein [Candidatus Cloacimonetes bacterium]|nr:amidohydrolase family protein [Candidatus Cloacimonadota bacterium]
MDIDILIKNGLILHFDKETQTESIAISNGKILEIGKNLDRKYQANRIIEAENKIVIPGFVNTHTHAAMSYFKGLADDLPLHEWLSQHIWPAEAKFLSPEFVEDASLYGCAEMIKNGITCFNDMYFFGDQTAKSAEKVGIRAVLGEGVLDFSAANHKNADEILSLINEMHQKYLDNQLIDFAVAPHSIYTCGKANLIKARDLANKLGLLVHIHISEAKQEIEDSLTKNGVRPVEYLHSFGFFEGDTIAAHAIWLDEEEKLILAETNTSVAINISSNLKLACGFMSLKNYIDKGINLSIGTDSVASNNNLSIFQEMSLISKLQKSINEDPTLLPAKDILQIATLGGAKALGKSNMIGSLETGKRADIILVDVQNIQAQPLYDPFSQLVYSLNSENIKDVIVNGKIVMLDRILVNIDELELIEKAKYYQNIIKKFNNG